VSYESVSAPISQLLTYVQSFLIVRPVHVTPSDLIREVTKTRSADAYNGIDDLGIDDLGRELCSSIDDLGDELRSSVGDLGGEICSSLTVTTLVASSAQA
jgi:hypothetical protein